MAPPSRISVRIRSGKGAAKRRWYFSGAGCTFPPGVSTGCEGRERRSAAGEKAGGSGCFSARRQYKILRAPCRVRSLRGSCPENFPPGRRAYSRAGRDPVSRTAAGSSDPIKQLRKEMGFWDVLLFNIATILGPRWIAAAAHNGTSSISLLVLSAVFFFVLSAMVINELSSRFPEEGGLYVWAKEAFGDFHGFVAGWNYWIYTVFYFPGLLLASAAMSAYIIGEGGGTLAQDRTFLLLVSLGYLLVAVILNLIGLNIGKWVQNAGGVFTYVPLLHLAGVAGILWLRHGSVTPISWANILPVLNWDTVNFCSQLAFAFTGLELVSTMSAEIRDPRRTLPRAVFAAGALIALMYIVG